MNPHVPRECWRAWAVEHARAARQRLIVEQGRRRVRRRGDTTSPPMSMGGGMPARQQWRNTIETYANPVIGRWRCVTLTWPWCGAFWSNLGPQERNASRVRGRIESIIDWASPWVPHHGQSARWKGVWAFVSTAFRWPTHVSPPCLCRHAGVVQARASSTTSARALEFLILTACGRAGAQHGQVRSGQGGGRSQRSA